MSNSEKTQKFQMLFARMLINDASDLLAGITTVNSIIEKIKIRHSTTEPSVSNAVRAMFQVPADSPIVQALGTTPSKVTIDRKLFQSNASLAYKEFEKQCDLIASLVQYHPTPDQRSYVLQRMYEMVDEVKKRFNEMEADQIRFEMPK